MILREPPNRPASLLSPATGLLSNASRVLALAAGGYVVTRVALGLLHLV